VRSLVTGGAGFLGSHLCDALVARGDYVVCLDNLSSGRRANVEHLLGAKNFQFAEADIRRKIELDGEFDVVAHLASPASPPDYLSRPLDTLTTGSQGTLSALEFAQEKGARFMMASTSEVYGDPLVHPQPETYWGNVNPVGPRSVYDEAKRYAEALTTAYGDTHGIDVGIIRIFNTFGPRMRAEDGRAVTTFIVQALRGQPLTVTGESHTRSFCYVDDLIRGIVAMLDSSERGPINLGNPHEMTVQDLAELIIELTGTSAGIVQCPSPEDDPERRKPIIERANELLGWSPSVSIEDGLTQTIAWFREHPDEVAAATVPVTSGHGGSPGQPSAWN
jgi:dTDP-glucose 4,6-dehydratase